MIKNQGEPKAMHTWCDHCHCLHTPPVIGAPNYEFMALGTAYAALSAIAEGAGSCEQKHCSEVAFEAMVDVGKIVPYDLAKLTANGRKCPSCGNCNGPTRRWHDGHYYCQNMDCQNYFDCTKEDVKRKTFSGVDDGKPRTNTTYGAKRSKSRSPRPSD